MENVRILFTRVNPRPLLHFEDRFSALEAEPILMIGKSATGSWK